jgi:type IV pilus assembly protein PilA
MKTNRGFTLIELMIVIAIMGILTTIALPTYHDRVIRAQVGEALAFADFAKEAIAEQYKRTRRIARTNAEAGLPESDKIIGSYVTGLEVKDGAINVTLGNRINKFASGKVVSVRAAAPPAPAVPLSWACGNAAMPAGLTVSGANATTLPPTYLPVDCRS